MLGLFVSQVMAYAALGAIGFALGWTGFNLLHAERRRMAEREVEQLRVALSEAQLRHARAS